MIQLLQSFRDVLELKVVDKMPKAIITDLRDVELSIEFDEVDQIKDHYLRHSAAYDLMPVAILASDPQVTAFAQIAKFRIGSELNSQIFSTLEAAENWANLQIAKSEMREAKTG